MTYTTEDEVREASRRVHRKICRLYNTMTPVWVIENLLRDLRIATENDLRLVKG